MPGQSHWRPLAISVFICCLGCKNTPEQREDTGDEPVLVDAAIERVVAELGVVVEEMMIPGMSVAIIKQDGSLWSDAVGLSDYDADSDMFSATPLKAGSTTKTVTAGRVLQLVEAGLLSLDDPVAAHVDVIAATHGIQIKHLLSHSSGLEDYSAYISASSATSFWADEDLVALIADLPLRFEPGENYYYSNSNFVILGMVVASVTGEPWQEELDSLLISQGISTAWIPEEDWGNTSPGYFVYPDGALHSVDGQAYNTVNDFHPSLIGAAGSMVSDVVGLVQWGDALWGGEGVLSADTRALMVTPVVDGAYYGLGTIVLEDAHGDLWGHDGAVNGYESYVGHRPDDGVTLAIMGNAWLSYNDVCCAPGWGGAASDRLWNAFYEEE